MSTRPTTPIPTWSTAGTNTEPGAGKKSAGWTVNERPPAEWLNWLQHSAGEWLQFLADVTSGSATPDLKLNFSNTDMFAPLLEVTTAPAAAGYRLLQRVLVNATQHANVYAGNGARRLVFAFNAVWGGSSWVCENSAQAASAFALVGDSSQNTLELLWHAATAGVWSDASWGRGNALVNSFGATGGTFTNLTVTQDLTVQRDATVTRNLTVGNNIVVTHDITAEDIISNTLAVDNVYDRSAGGIIVHAMTSLVAGATIDGDHLFLNDGVDIVHPGPVDAQPVRPMSLDMSLGQPVSGFGDAYFSSEGAWLPVAASGGIRVRFPLHVPRATARIKIECVWTGNNIAQLNSAIVYKVVREFIGGGTIMSIPPVPEQLGATITQGIATAGAIMNSATITYDFDPTLESYCVEARIADGTGNKLFAVRYNLSDPGPRNG